ncbi:MAG: hypothetical protein HIU86_07365 [Acidobacteria bacterium]|nr:hypothetical protein [Acidobacteriota bacterium]
MTRGRPIRVVRVVLVGLGAVLIAIGGGALVVGVPTRQWSGILLWLAGAVVLHDALFAPLVLIGSRVLRRVGARVSWLQVAVVQVALVVGAAVTLIAIPGIAAQARGARNPSVLVFPYALHLGVAWAAIGVLTAATVLVIALRRRRRETSPSVP